MIITNVNTAQPACGSFFVLKTFRVGALSGALLLRAQKLFRPRAHAHVHDGAELLRLRLSCRLVLGGWRRVCILFCAPSGEIT